MKLVFDIETAADPSVIPLLKPLKAAGNLKDPLKIALDVQEKEAKRLAGLSLDPCTGRIVAIGTPEGVVTCTNADAEREALILFWARAAGETLVGYNCVAFDLPFMLTRSIILGVTAPDFDIRKYGCPSVIDLMLKLSFSGILDYRSLDFCCQRLALNTPPDPFDGSDIQGLVDRGAWGDVISHCRCDVARTSALAQRLGLLK